MQIRTSIRYLAIASCILFLAARIVLGEDIPTLKFSLVDGNAILTWASKLTDWHLSASTTLNAADSQLVTQVPTVIGGQNVVTVPVTTAQQFFNLKKRGANVPFITIEAEAAQNSGTGTIVKMTQPPASNVITPELEASARGYVELNQTGQYLDFPGVPASNTIVLRHCIPDAPTGGGISGTLSLYVNGVFRQKLLLTSNFNWLYGTPGQNGQSNDPAAGSPHVFWDETRAFIVGGLAQGDTLRLEKDADDTAAFYRLDLVDLEKVDAPLVPPPKDSFLSVADYGADGSDVVDDTAAIQKCIADAKSQGKIVWIPPGTYYQTAMFTLDGVKLQGAGMWYTKLIGTTVGTRSGNVGFALTGDGAKVSDLSVESAVHNTRTLAGGKPFNTDFSTINWAVSNVWITHTNVGFWMSGAKNGRINGCRVRLTYADGINLNRGSSNNLVEMNHVRGCGDDGIAISSETTNTPSISTNDTVRSNTVIANWWGHNCDIAGGSGHVIEDNLLADNSIMGCLTINLPSSYPMYPLTGATIRRNTILRGGGFTGGQKRGAVWIYPGSQAISGVTFSDNEMIDSVFYAIQLVGTWNQQITFERNIIDNPGERGFLINSQVTGSGIFNGNIFRSPKLNKTNSFSNSSANYSTSLDSNSWQ